MTKYVTVVINLMFVLFLFLIMKMLKSKIMKIKIIKIEILCTYISGLHRSDFPHSLCLSSPSITQNSLHNLGDPSTTEDSVILYSEL